MKVLPGNTVCSNRVTIVVLTAPVPLESGEYDTPTPFCQRLSTVNGVETKTSLFPGGGGKLCGPSLRQQATART